MTQVSKNWFDQGGSSYASFRPQYPDELAGFLAKLAPNAGLAIDVGCGTGQLTRQLAGHFTAVIGADPSADQIAHAVPHANIDYVCAPAETLPLPDKSASLIAAAQAAHWFDLPVFYDEVRRIGADGAVIALISYGVMQFNRPDLQARFSTFYEAEIGPYWPPERKMVDTGYADIPFPFKELSGPALTIERSWSLADLLGYISTWSAVRSVTEAGQAEILQAFAVDMEAIWGDPTARHLVRSGQYAFRQTVVGRHADLKIADDALAFPIAVARGFKPCGATILKRPFRSLFFGLSAAFLGLGQSALRRRGQNFFRRDVSFSIVNRLRSRFAVFFK